VKLATPWGEFLFNWNPNSNLAQVFITDLSDNRTGDNSIRCEFSTHTRGSKDEIEIYKNEAKTPVYLKNAENIFWKIHR
jgi:hypothetical protein